MQCVAVQACCNSGLQEGLIWILVTGENGYFRGSKLRSVSAGELLHQQQRYSEGSEGAGAAGLDGKS